MSGFWLQPAESPLLQAQVFHVKTAPEEHHGGSSDGTRADPTLHITDQSLAHNCKETGEGGGAQSWLTGASENAWGDAMEKCTNAGTGLGRPEAAGCSLPRGTEPETKLQLGAGRGLLTVRIPGKQALRYLVGPGHITGAQVQSLLFQRLENRIHSHAQSVLGNTGIFLYWLCWLLAAGHRLSPGGDRALWLRAPPAAGLRLSPGGDCALWLRAPPAAMRHLSSCRWHVGS